MSTYKHHLITSNTITVIYNDKVVNVRSSDIVKFTKVKELIAMRRFDEIEQYTSLGKMIENKSYKKFTIKNNQIYVGKDPMPKALSDLMLKFIDNKIDFDPILNFWGNLKLNPSQESREHLYLFLENSRIPLTYDGCFIGYKVVTSTYLDKHTRTIDNKPGTIVKMARKLVDSDRSVECSSGLHICSWQYIQGYRNRDDILLQCKVNPKDVVSVPRDCNNTKIRVCEYKVIGIYGQETLDETIVKEENSKAKVIRTIEEKTSSGEKIVETKAKTSIITNRPVQRKDGRVYIPASLCRKAGFHIGDKVYLVMVIPKKSFKITKKKPGKMYIVTSDITLKISGAIFTINNMTVKRVKVNATKNCIEFTK